MCNILITYMCNILITGWISVQQVALAVDAQGDRCGRSEHVE
jgi:hypothetical protein